MSSASNHVIRRTSIEVTGSVKDAFRFQQEVVVWAHDHLVPQLDRIFGSLPDSGESVRIDRLEIELNASDFGNWGDEILDKLKSELVSVLMNRTRSEQTGRVEAPGQSFLDKLGYYLETGAAPWSLAVNSRAAFEEEMKAWLSTSEIGTLRPQVAELLQSERVRFRFLASFSQPLLRETLTVFFAVPDRVWKSLSLDSEILRHPESRPGGLPSFSSPDPVSIPLILLREFVAALAANSFIYSERVELEAVQAFLTGLAADKQSVARDLAPVRFHSKSFQRAREAVLEAGSVSDQSASADSKLRPVEPSLRPVPSASGPTTSNPPETAGPVAPAEPDTDTDTPGPTRVNETAGPGPEAAPRASEEQKRQRQDPAIAGIFIQNAGLILLAPFLNIFLERVGLARDGKLNDPALAMCLMHYLACGEEGPAEFQVVLPKILCGWDLEKEIALPGAIPDAMKEEARTLLESLIGHWTILKDTSPKGLQEAFLCRAGKISLTKNKEWLLQVEQKAFDMVLQQLPWSFNLIKLSWMKRLLRTEWVG